MNLEEYLLQRGLDLDPINIEQGDPILANDDLLREVAEMWNSHRRAVVAVLQVRVHSIGRELLIKAIPQETIVLRQSIAEVGKIVDYFDKCASEWNKRNIKTAETPPAENDEGTSL